MKKIKYKNLIQFHEEILLQVGLDQYSIKSVTTGLCETSLRGVDSHGVRLLPHYVNSAITGRKNPKPKFTISNSFPSIAHLDADNAFGHAAGMKSIEIAMNMAENQGVGIVGVSNSSHPGAMASMALKAARKGFIALAFTHADALVLSHNGKRPYFGTNPICIAVPREEKEPYCLDMASSIVSWNKVLVKKNSETELAEGIAANSNGELTTNPVEATCLLPAGSYKGFGIASMVDILCGVYTGMNFGRSIPSMYKASMEKPRHLGQFYIVFRADGVIDKKDFLSSMQTMSDEVRNEPSKNDKKVMMPGDPEIDTSKIRLKEGIPLDEMTLNSFRKLSKQFDVELKLC